MNKSCPRGCTGAQMFRDRTGTLKCVMCGYEDYTETQESEQLSHVISEAYGIAPFAYGTAFGTVPKHLSAGGITVRRGV